MSNIKARRRLSDLYKRGTEVRFVRGKPPEVAQPDANGTGYLLDDQGRHRPLEPDAVQVWVQPPSPLQREQAMREGTAARARSLVRAKRNEDSEEHLTIMAFLVDMEFETLIDYVLLAEEDNYRNEATRDTLALDEWDDMDALQDAGRQYEEMSPEDIAANQEEYDAFMEVDARFGKQVREKQAELMETQREIYRTWDRAQLEKKALDKRSEIVGNQAFMYEYEKQMTWYGVRDFDNPELLFFGNAREFAEQDEQIIEAVREALTLFIQDSGEAKNWQGVVSGSESSELPSEPETSAPSTPVEVIG